MIRKYILATVMSGVIIAPFLSMQAFAGTYGSGNYSNCAYGDSCPTPIATPMPTVNPLISPTPSPAPTNVPVPTSPPIITPTITPKPGTEIKIAVPNISKDKPISTARIDVDINISKINTTTNEPLKLDEVGWVALYVGDKLIGTSYNISTDGATVIPWDLSRAKANIISVVAYSTSGTPLARKDIEVTYIAGIQDVINQKNTTTSQVAGQQKDKQGGFLSSIIGDTGSLGNIGKISKPVKLAPAAEVVLISFPFWLFIILFLMAVRLIWQASREVIASRRIQQNIALQKDLNDQKITFISLVSHYLNTPYTIINGAIDSLGSVDKIASEKLIKLKDAANNLQTSINKLVEAAKKQPDVNVQLSSGEMAYFEKPAYKSMSFLIPVAAVGIIIFIINMVLQIVTTVSLNSITLLVQTIVFVAVITFLLLAIRNSRLRKKEKQTESQALTQQETLDASRNAFIRDTASTLRKNVDNIIEASFPVQNASSFKYLDRGIRQLQSSIYKFELANKVEEGAVAVNNITTIDINKFIDGILTKNHGPLTKKRLAVLNNVPAVNVSQNILLFGFILDTVINNAIKFSKENGTIKIDVKEDGANVHITVADNGIGIAKSKLDKLFDPFNRATSITQFDYEGMGFSLYLSHLIAQRIRGSLIIESDEGKGTNVYITVPKHAVE